MRPSSSPKGSEPVNSTDEIVQSWHKYGQCPDGTVPLKRTPRNIITKPAGSSEVIFITFNSYFSNISL